MSAGQEILDAIEELFTIIQDDLDAWREHHRLEQLFRSKIMSNVTDLIAASEKLIEERSTMVADLASTKATLATTQSELAAAQATIADNEAAAGAQEAKINAAIAAETGTDTITGSVGNDLVHADPLMPVQ